jgi:hypothetical protein
VRVDVLLAGYRELVQWSKQFPERRHVVENARGLGRHLAQRLVARGEFVLDVPPRLGSVGACSDWLIPGSCDHGVTTAGVDGGVILRSWRRSPKERVDADQGCDSSAGSDMDSFTPNAKLRTSWRTLLPRSPR